MQMQIKRLAENLVRHSTEVKKGQHVLIQCYGVDGAPLVKELVNAVYSAGAYPMVDLRDMQVERAMRMGYDVTQANFLAQHEYNVMKSVDVFIGINATDNISELSGVKSEADKKIAAIGRKVLIERIENTRWVVLRYPNAAMAQLFDSPTELFTEYFFDVCNIDYKRLGKCMDKLADRLNNTDKVRIVSPGTDLAFSVKGIGTVVSNGNVNMPDGEVMTAPVRTSVNGEISFNCPAVFRGNVFENIKLSFKDGKVETASCPGKDDLLQQILAIDENASYIGEFAFGVNPKIRKPMKDVLFDEKIAGSIHLALGNCYSVADNGNPSALHWDLVLLLEKKFGGGEIYFDDELIQKDGKFVVEDLICLNPEYFNTKEEQ